jgi:hypothetical protein
LLRTPLTADNPNGQNISVTFNTNTFNDAAGTAALAITSETVSGTCEEIMALKVH